MAKADCQRRYVHSKLLEMADRVATADQMDKLRTLDNREIRRFLRKMGVLPPDKRVGRWVRHREGDRIETKIGVVQESADPKMEKRKSKMEGKHLAAVEREQKLIRARESGLVCRGLMGKEEWEKKWGPWPVASISTTS